MRRRSGAAECQQGPRLTLFHKPKVTGVPWPRGRVRQGSFHFGDRVVDPPHIYDYLFLRLISLTWVLLLGWTRGLLKQQLKSAKFTLLGRWVLLEQPEQHPKASNKGELPAAGSGKLSSSKGKLWEVGASRGPTALQRVGKFMRWSISEKFNPHNYLHIQQDLHKTNCMTVLQLYNT